MDKNTTNETVTVWCSFQVEGIHCWADCPFDEISYLRDPHRHMFHIKAYATVSHHDRDIEFIMLKHKVQEYLNENYWNDLYKCLYFGTMSCEMIGRELSNKFNLCKCEVSEDGENGAIVEYN